jgi:hypothetical protein
MQGLQKLRHLNSNEFFTYFCKVILVVVLVCAIFEICGSLAAILISFAIFLPSRFSLLGRLLHTFGKRVAVTRPHSFFPTDQLLPILESKRGSIFGAEGRGFLVRTDSAFQYQHYPIS